MARLLPPLRRAALAGSLLALVGILAPADAAADDLGSRENQRGHITRLNEGLFLLGVDSTLILTRTSQGGASVFRANAIGAGSLHYLLRDNLGVSFRTGMLYRKSGEVRDLGGIGAGWANKYLRLGEGMFFGPGAGAGLLLAQRDVPSGTGAVARARLFGLMLGVELPLNVFLNERFSLKAGPELMMSFGGSSPEEGAGSSFFDLDSSFKIGAAYSF